MGRPRRLEVTAIALSISVAATLATAAVAGAQADVSPSASPSVSVLAGPQTLVGTDFLLIGYLDAPGGRYVSVDPTARAWLSFSRDDAGERIFDATTGCLDLRGEWTRGAKRADTPTRTMALDVWGRDELPTCPAGIEAQDAAVRRSLASVGAYTLAAEGYDALAYQLIEDDFDAPLWSHFREVPELVRLVLRDQSGEATLIYVPGSLAVLAACGLSCLPAPSADAATATQSPAPIVD